ncbi:BUD13 [Nymphon striatum]|nr:BUD13 [Nymphon striatum]
MSVSMSKEEYLKRYLSDASKKPKRKKIKDVERIIKQKKSDSFKIFDDDVDTWKSKMIKSETEKQNLESKESSDEEAPAIAEIVDDRPWEVKRKEVYTEDKWRNFGHQETDQHEKASSEDKLDSENDQSSVRMSCHDSYNSDQSPSRKTRHDSADDSDDFHTRKENNSDVSPPRKNRRDSGNSDYSPPRKQTKVSDNDISPPRHHTKNSDSDFSPPRRKRDDSSSDGKRKRTLAGTKAGLQDAKSMREEISAIQKRDLEMSNVTFISRNTTENHYALTSGKLHIFMLEKVVNETVHKGKAHQLLSKVSYYLLEIVDRDSLEMLNSVDMGKDAVPQLRKSAKLKLQQDQIDKEEKEKKEAILKEKYSRWGKGLKQTEIKNKLLQADLHEISKPLSRYEGDEDLERHLKDKEDVADPMFEYMRKKKLKRNKDNSKGSSFPVYNGPAPPPNRFNLHPGYRWDGVDRSNGFEKKIFMKKASKEATKEEMHKWSVEDM